MDSMLQHVLLHAPTWHGKHRHTPKICNEYLMIGQGFAGLEGLRGTVIPGNNNNNHLAERLGSWSGTSGQSKCSSLSNMATKPRIELCDSHSAHTLAPPYRFPRSLAQSDC